MMSCTLCGQRCLRFVQGISLFIVCLLYRLLTFLSFLSLSVGITTCIAEIYEASCSSKMTMFWHTYFTQWLLCGFSEVYDTCDEVCSRRGRCHSLTRSFPFFLVTLPSIIYIIIGIIAFAQLYMQFSVIHVQDSIFQIFQDDPEAKGFSDVKSFVNFDANSISTAVFLLSLSYLNMCISKYMHRDLVHVMENLPHPESCRHCLAMIIMLVVQIIATFFYTCPIAIVAVIDNLHNEVDSTSFLQLTMLAIFLGVAATFFEISRLWPGERLTGPFCWYENNLRARAILLQIVLLPTIILLFYYTGEGKIAKHKPNWPYFCFVIAMSSTTLHVTKMFITAKCVNHNGYADVIQNIFFDGPEDAEIAFDIANYEPNNENVEQGVNEQRGIVVASFPANCSARQKNETQVQNQQNGNNNNNVDADEINEENQGGESTTSSSSSSSTDTTNQDENGNTIDHNNSIAIALSCPTVAQENSSIRICNEIPDSDSRLIIPAPNKRVTIIPKVFTSQKFKRNKSKSTKEKTNKN